MVIRVMVAHEIARGVADVGGVRLKCSSRKAADPVGANTPGTPSIASASGGSSTTTSATALPSPP